MNAILNRAILTALSGVLTLSAQQVISQVADGASWKTTVALTNTTASAANATLIFYKDTTGGATEPWTPTFSEGNNTTGLSVPAGSTIFLHTPGTATVLSQGWAQMSAPSGIQAYVIYTQTNSGRASDATAQAVTPATRILMPFDNTSGLVTAMAIVNPNAAAEDISVNFRTSGGVTSGSLGSVPAMGQMAFTIPQQFADLNGQAGLAEFYSTGSFTIIALRANPSGGFTSSPAYFESGAPIITGGSSGTGGTTGTGGSSNNVIFGGFGLSESTLIASTGTTMSETAGGAFSDYSATAWATPVITISPCNITKVDWSASATYPLQAGSLLDAGEIDISGPNLSTMPLTKTSSSFGPGYSLQLSNGTLQSGGTYTLTGKGGTQVGPFTVSTTMPADFTVTNLSSINGITRSAPLTVNWTGSGFADVAIVASSLVYNTSGMAEEVTVACYAAANLGTFSVPTAALAYLDPVAPGSLLSSGSLTVSTVPVALTSKTAIGAASTQLTPPLVGGGSVNYGVFEGSVGFTKTLPIT